MQKEFHETTELIKIRNKKAEDCKHYEYKYAKLKVKDKDYLKEYEEEKV